jgi:acyl carrier protein
MNNEIVGEKVRSVLASKLNIDPGTIKGDTRLAEDLGLDSFGGVEIMFDIEDAFGLKIPDSEIEHVRTVDDVVAYIVEWNSKVGTKNAPA